MTELSNEIEKLIIQYAQNEQTRVTRFNTVVVSFRIEHLDYIAARIYVFGETIKFRDSVYKSSAEFFLQVQEIYREQESTLADSNMEALIALCTNSTKKTLKFIATTNYHPITIDSFETKQFGSLGEYYELKEPIDKIQVQILPDAGSDIIIVITDNNTNTVKEIGGIKNLEQALIKVNEYFQVYFFEYPEEIKSHSTN